MEFYGNTYLFNLRFMCILGSFSFFFFTIINKPAIMVRSVAIELDCLVQIPALSLPWVSCLTSLNFDFLLR